MNKKTQQIGLGSAILLIIVGILYVESTKTQRVHTASQQSSITLTTNPAAVEKAKKYSLAHDISTPDAFINTQNISIKELVGKYVVLVDFWTYSCINCQRTTPYLNAWYEKYADKGLVIIGVHTPEFRFEEKLENVQRAVQQFGIKFPVALDNDYSTWSAYRNNYWPRKYLVDIDGFVVYDHIGEGGYEETEREIQRLLRERATRLNAAVEIPQTIAEPVVAKVTYNQNQSPEIYFGSDRNKLLGNGAQGKSGTFTFKAPDIAQIKSNTVYFDGQWQITSQYAQNVSANARIIFKYNARNVYMVAAAAQEVMMNVMRDGEIVKKENAGEDVELPTGAVKVKNDQLYKLIHHESQTPGEHILELIIKQPGLKAFTFTFG